MIEISDDSWDITFMNIAEMIAERHSTCIRLQVGCVIAKDKRIISIGYNGALRHKIHCDEYFKKFYDYNINNLKEKYSFEEFIRTESFKEIHRDWSKINEAHAEQNALSFAAKNGISVDGASLYCTWTPCTYCAKSIVSAGIKNVFYRKLYDREDTRDFLKENMIYVCQA